MHCSKIYGQQLCAVSKKCYSVRVLAIIQKRQNMLLRGAIYGITAASIWGGMYVVSDIVLEVIPPFTLLTIRLLLAVFILSIILGVSGRGLPPRDAFVRFLLVGLVGMGISLGAQFAGTDLSTAVNGALVTSASPVFIMLFAVLILREKLSTRRILAGALAIIGVLVILNPAEADFGSETFLGDIFLAIAALTWGLYSVLVRWAGRGTEADTLLITTIASFGGLFISLPAAGIELTQNSIGMIDGGGILGILYLGIISTALSMWLWNRAFALVDASVASLFFFAQPVSGALLGAIFLNQPMTPALWIGAILIATGVLLSLQTPKKAPVT